MTLFLIFAVGAGMILIERLWPARQLPQVRNWWARVVLVNAVQLGIVVLAGFTWDQWMRGHSLFNLSETMPTIASVALGYLVVTFIYYFWHRVRHESKLFWRLCHQLHHSPARLEVITSFYKHPVEITLNSLLSAAIAFPLLGLSPGDAAILTLVTAVAEYFYHWNIRTPRWFGVLFQRPESHRVHHRRGHHTHNYADLPIWDMLFGTFSNPDEDQHPCGFSPSREDRFDDMLAFRNVHQAERDNDPPLGFLPTCIGCSKRWACQLSRERAGAEAVNRIEASSSVEASNSIEAIDLQARTNRQPEPATPENAA